MYTGCIPDLVVGSRLELVFKPVGDVFITSIRTLFHWTISQALFMNIHFGPSGVFQSLEAVHQPWLPAQQGRVVLVHSWVVFPKTQASSTLGSARDTQLAGLLACFQSDCSF